MSAGKPKSPQVREPPDTIARTMRSSSRRDQVRSRRSPGGLIPVVADAEPRGAADLELSPIGTSLLSATRCRLGGSRPDPARLRCKSSRGDPCGDARRSTAIPAKRWEMCDLLSARPGFRVGRRSKARPVAEMASPLSSPPALRTGRRQAVVQVLHHPLDAGL